MDFILYFCSSKNKMKLPIYVYNDKILTLPGADIDNTFPNLSQIIEDMFETMYNAGGIGLAAHQVGIPIKLFIVDVSHYSEADDSLKDFKKVFINSEIIEEGEEDLIFTEGCLSFPGLQIDIKRKTKIKLKYQDENFVVHEEWFDGIASRCIQHEHDHTNGILFLKKTDALRRRLVDSKVKQILKRNFSTNYKCKL